MESMSRLLQFPRLALLALLSACASMSPPVSGVATAPADVRSALRQFVDSLTGAPEFRSMHWGVLIVDPGRGETLYSRNADKLFMPASNMKLLTGTTALTQLGPDYRWPTTVWARGPVRNGVLEGDLVVKGQGDPSGRSRSMTATGVSTSLRCRPICRSSNSSVRSAPVGTRVVVIQRA